MFDVYINNFKQGNTIVTTEKLMFSVPSAAGFPITKPVVKSNEDAADNFSFSMEVDSPYYDTLLPMKTMFRVVYDGDVIFYGRVMNISKSTVYQTKSVICEGTLAYFKDTFYEGKPDKLRSKMSVSDYYTRIINNHNTLVPSKKIYKGTVGVSLPSENEKYEPTAWTQSSSLISNLASNYGGHMRMRYSGTTSYLDWYKYYVRDLGDDQRPSISVGKNIIDISSESDNNNIFTRVIPIGDTDNNGKPIYVENYTYKDKNNSSHRHTTKYIPVTLMNSLYSNAQLNDEFHSASDYSNSETNYGIIYTTMSFSDATTQAKLWDLAKKWIKECYFGFVESFSIKAVDMHAIGTSVPKILLGECVDVNYRTNVDGSIVWVKKKLVCKSVQYDLFNPENSSYSIGIPSDLLEHNRNNKKSSKAKEVSASTSSRAIPKKDEEPECTFGTIWMTILDGDGSLYYYGEAAARSFKENGELSGTVRVYDPDDIPAGENPLNHKDKWFDARIVGKITIDTLRPKIVCVSADRGIFAYNAGATGVNIYAVANWYSKKKGYNYEGIDPLKSEEESGDIFATDDQTLEGNRTIVFQPTVLDGIDSAGKMLVGYDLTAPGDKWNIQLNVPIQYRDADGRTVRASGFVSAKDFNVEEIPSFKTKLGIFDIVIAGKVQAQQISADLAEVRKWLGDNITAGTFIRTQTLSATNINVSNEITADKFLLETEVDGSTWRTQLGSCFYDALMTENNGVVTLSLSRANGSTSKTVNFNMAGTQFFIDQINSVYGSGYSASINPGQDTTVTLKYRDPQTGVVRDTGKSYTIHANDAKIGYITGVRVDDDYNEHNPGSFYVSGVGVETKYFENYLYLTVGTWHDGGTHGFSRDYIACNIRLGGTTGTLVARRWIMVPESYSDTSGNI